jgi:hypothetical protein
MNDLETQQRIEVSAAGTGGPYLMVPLDQLASIEAVLRSEHLSYWVDSDAISLDGKAAVVFINLGRGTDVNRVQKLLDAAK